MSERKLFAHELEARLDELLLLSLRQRSAAEPAAQLEALPREQQERVLHWAGVAAQTSDDLGWLIASLAAVQAASLGPQLDDWVRAGLDAYDRSGLAATRKALNEFAEASKASARAFADRALPSPRSRAACRASCMRSTAGRCNCVSGPRAWTDSETLWLPERLDLATDAAGNRRLYKAVAALLWAQARFGTFNVDPEPELELWPDRERRWPGSPCSRPCASKPALPSNCPGLPHEIAALRGPWPADLARQPPDAWRGRRRPPPTASPAWPKSEESALATRRSFRMSARSIRLPRAACARRASRASWPWCGAPST
jgi:nitric oxide reductase NorD protein